MITIDEYTNFVRSRKVYKNAGSEVIYPVLGLLGELGELIEKCDDGANDGALLSEAGDVLWYIVAVADDVGLTLSDIPSSAYVDNTAYDALIYGLRYAAVMADKTKKILRDGVVPDGKFWVFNLGRVRSSFMTFLRLTSLDIRDVMQNNVDKLNGRVARGTIHGNGDNR